MQFKWKFPNPFLRREFPHPIRTIYSTCPSGSLAQIALSADGRNIVTASAGRGSSIKLHEWSFGTDVDSSKGLAANQSLDVN